VPESADAQGLLAACREASAGGGRRGRQAPSEEAGATGGRARFQSYPPPREPMDGGERPR
jgi:hypothetical protein